MTKNQLAFADEQIKDSNFDPALFIPKLEEEGYRIQVVFHDGQPDGIATYYPDTAAFGDGTLYREFISCEREASDGAETTADYLIETGRIYGRSTTTCTD